MIESWKKRLNLSLAERVALSLFSRWSIENIISDIHKAEAFEVKNDLLKVSEFLVVLGGLEHQLNEILSRVTRLAGLNNFKCSPLIEQLNNLGEIYWADICPRGLDSLDYNLEKLFEGGTQVANFRQRIGTGQVSMHSQNGSWKLPNETMEEYQKMCMVRIGLSVILDELSRDVNDEYREKFGPL